MKKRILGHSSLYVSEIGLGCMSLKPHSTENERILDTAIENGINFLDTADLYDYGWNETYIGQWMKPHRNNIILATKGGNQFVEGKEGWTWNASKPYLLQAVKNSLHRLQTDWIDLYQLHGGTIEDQYEETIDALETMKREGLIREYGISSIRPNVIQRFATHSRITSVMMQYSLLDRRPEEWLPYLDEHHISIIARGGVAKGLLTERNPQLWKENVKQKGYLDYDADELRISVQQLQQYAKQWDMTLQQLALAYLLHHSTVATVIPGASTVEQLQQNITASTVTLLNEQVQVIQDITKPNQYAEHR